MLSHEQIWTAIDRLAERHGFGLRPRPPGGARRDELQPLGADRARRAKALALHESISKVLAATGATLDEFLRLIEPREGPPRAMIPLIGMTQAGSGRLFTEEGMPTGGPGLGGDRVPRPRRGACLRARGPGRFYEPAVPGRGRPDSCRATASVRKGDRVVVRLHVGEVIAKELQRPYRPHRELASLNPEHEDRS